MVVVTKTYGCGKNKCLWEQKPKVVEQNLWLSEQKPMVVGTSLWL
jgi:hypothetical protein